MNQEIPTDLVVMVMCSDGVELHCECRLDLPFVPSIGMGLNTDGGDAWRVKDVIWNVCDNSLWVDLENVSMRGTSGIIKKSLIGWSCHE